MQFNHKSQNKQQKSTVNQRFYKIIIYSKSYITHYARSLELFTVYPIPPNKWNLSIKD